MYIHLGMGVVVREEDVVGIFDMGKHHGLRRNARLKRAQKRTLWKTCAMTCRVPLWFAEIISAASACISRQTCPGPTLLKRSRAEIGGIALRPHAKGL